jgi:cobalamin-dependent methionine synthase I
MIGECTNANGSKAFREVLIADEVAEVLEIA